MRLSDSDWATIQHWFDDLVELEPERREEARAGIAGPRSGGRTANLEAHEMIGILDRITGQVAEPAPARLRQVPWSGPFAVINKLLAVAAWARFIRRRRGRQQVAPAADRPPPTRPG